MATLNTNLGAINSFSPILTNKKVGVETPVVANKATQTTSQPQDGASIDFGSLSAAPASTLPPAVPSAAPTVEQKAVSSGLEVAVASAGLTLSQTGSLAVLDDVQAASSSEAPGKPFSLRNADLTAIKVSPETVAAQSMVFMNEPSEVKGYFKDLMGDKPVQLATAGYSAPPEGYEGPTTKFLTGLAQELKGDIGFVTSPTADKGSIDAITSTVGQREGAPIGYVTADSYLGYVNPDNFPADIDKNQFAAQPKFAFPDADIYSKGTAELSNSFLVTGGRNASISDFKNAVLNGNQVVILTNDEVKSASWDPKKNRVDNASAYLGQMLSGNTEGIPMDNAFNQDVMKFLQDNKEAVSQHVISVDANDAGATGQAAKHLRA